MLLAISKLRQLGVGTSGDVIWPASMNRQCWRVGRYCTFTYVPVRLCVCVCVYVRVCACLSLCLHRSKSDRAASECDFTTRQLLRGTSLDFAGECQ